MFSEIIDGIIEKERKKFAAKDQSFDKNNKENNNMTMIPYEIQLPRNENEIRKYYIESKFSICDNLPIPHIQNLSNHAYISPIDIIRNILGHGLPLDTINGHSLNNKGTTSFNISRISQSVRAQEIFQNSINRFQNNLNTIML